MRRMICDGCLVDIDPSLGWFGLDEYIASDPDEEEDEDDPEDDVDYGFHFHSTACVWSWASARELEVTE